MEVPIVRRSGAAATVGFRLLVACDFSGQAVSSRATELYFFIFRYKDSKRSTAERRTLETYLRISIQRSTAERRTLETDAHHGDR